MVASAVGELCEFSPSNVPVRHTFFAFDFFRGALDRLDHDDVVVDVAVSSDALEILSINTSQRLLLIIDK